MDFIMKLLLAIQLVISDIAVGVLLLSLSMSTLLTFIITRVLLFIMCFLIVSGTLYFNYTVFIDIFKDTNFNFKRRIINYFKWKKVEEGKIFIRKDKKVIVKITSIEKGDDFIFVNIEVLKYNTINPFYERDYFDKEQFLLKFDFLKEKDKSIRKIS